MSLVTDPEVNIRNKSIRSHPPEEKITVEHGLQSYINNQGLHLFPVWPYIHIFITKAAEIWSDCPLLF